MQNYRVALLFRKTTKNPHSCVWWVWRGGGGVKTVIENLFPRIEIQSFTFRKCKKVAAKNYRLVNLLQIGTYY